VDGGAGVSSLVSLYTATWPASCDPLRRPLGARDGAGCARQDLWLGVVIDIARVGASTGGTCGCVRSLPHRAAASPRGAVRVYRTRWVRPAAGACRGVHRQSVTDRRPERRAEWGASIVHPFGYGPMGHFAFGDLGRVPVAPAPGPTLITVNSDESQRVPRQTPPGRGRSEQRVGQSSVSIGGCKTELYGR
jgi:hypothetical protein